MCKTCQSLHRFKSPESKSLKKAGKVVKAKKAKLTLEAVRQFIWKLPEEQRTILLLVVIEGVSYKDVSDMLSIPIGTVTSRLARARLAIKDFVEMVPS